MQQMIDNGNLRTALYTCVIHWTDLSPIAGCRVHRNLNPPSVIDCLVTSGELISISISYMKT